MSSPANIPVAGTALLIIDVQRELFAKSTPIYRAEQLLANVNLLMARAHAQGVPVFMVQHGAERHLRLGSEGWQLHPALQPLPADIPIHKSHSNVFQGTSLDEQLKARGIGLLIIAGLVTHGCVKAAALGALKLGYQVIVIGDGHSSFSKDAPQLIVEWNHKLSEAGAEIRPAEEVVFGG